MAKPAPKAPPDATPTPTTPISPIGKPTLYGCSVHNAADLTAKVSAFGPLKVARIYNNDGLPGSWTGSLEEAAACPVISSFKMLPSDVLAGTEDALLESWFGSVPQGGPQWWSYWHEPEDDIAQGTFALDDYLAAWEHISRIALAANNNFLHSTLILMGYSLLPASHRTWQEYVPSGGIIHTMGWDCYPPNGEGTPEPESFMSAAVTASQGAGFDQIGFAEFGTVTVTGRPAWLASVATYATSVGARYCSLYDSDYAGGLGGGGTFMVTDAESQQAWKTAVQA